MLRLLRLFTLCVVLVVAGCGGKPDAKPELEPSSTAVDSGGDAAPPSFAPPPSVTPEGFSGLSKSAPTASPSPEDAPQAAAPLTTPHPAATPSPDIRDIAPRLAEAQPRASGAIVRQPPFKTIRVFYGTNRQPTGSRTPAAFYGCEPGPLRFGFCDVSIPRDHEIGELEAPKLWKFEFREDPREHVVLMRVLPASGPEFLAALQQAVWDSIEWHDTPEGKAILGGEAFVFVHGFNNSFEDAARRTAQIASDLKFRGAPILYSWPSQGSPSLRGYIDDGDYAGLSQDHFVQFLHGVAQESGARKIHVIAHSMGNRLVTESLRRLAFQFTSGELPKFNQVILTAPDVDAEYFKLAIAPRIVQTAERITIYSSSHDLALKASSWANRLGRRRLGEAGKELSIFPEYSNIEVIDASAVDTGLFTLRHSYHADSPTVLKDLGFVLEGIPAAERGLKALLGHLAWQIRAAGKSIQDVMESVTAEREGGTAR